VVLGGGVLALQGGEDVVLQVRLPEVGPLEPLGPPREDMLLLPSPGGRVPLPGRVREVLLRELVVQVEALPPRLAGGVVGLGVRLEPLQVGVRGALGRRRRADLVPAPGDARADVVRGDRGNGGVTTRLARLSVKD
jgi:hypothetical protein